MEFLFTTLGCLICMLTAWGIMGLIMCIPESIKYTKEKWNEL